MPPSPARVSARSSTRSSDQNHTSDPFQTIFNDIKKAFRKFEKKCVVLSDEPQKYYLGTKKVREKDGYRLMLGGVEIKKNYVSVHLIPIYAVPKLGKGMTPNLKKKMQGKSCFSFTKHDPELIAEFNQLVADVVPKFTTANIPGFINE